jgi:DNA polymerase IV
MNIFMPKPRTILHVDLDAFFCSVEEILNPALKGTAFAVGAPADRRGVISTASYAARKFGVHSALPTARALQLCPLLVLLHGRHHLYGEYSQRVMDILADVTPDMEQVSIDEAFLDCTGDERSGMRIGAYLKQRILAETGLPCSIGIASNKLVAKIATECGKPDGLLEVPAGSEAVFLAPLPVRMLWGVGPKTQAYLEEFGIHTIGELAAQSEEEWAARFGQNSRSLSERARGIDDSPVEDIREAKSISQETTFPKDVADADTLRKTLREQSDQVAASLRREERRARTVRIKVRWPPFVTITRQTALAKPTAVSEEIFNAAWRLLGSVWHSGKPVRLLGVGVSRFTEEATQLSLFPEPDEKDRLRLEQTLDQIRERYGERAVRRASSLPAEKKKAPVDKTSGANRKSG